MDPSTKLWQTDRILALQTLPFLKSATYFSPDGPSLAGVRFLAKVQTTLRNHYRPLHALYPEVVLTDTLADKEFFTNSASS
jgi:hypothetical protein